jgi:hypothetical protein
MWEDEANANGGKWVLTMKNNPQLLDRCWAWLAMALVGEDLDEGDEICGAVVSLRSKVDRIQLWTRSKDDVEKINGIGKKMVKLLDVSEADGIGLEFQVCVIRLLTLPIIEHASSTIPTIVLLQINFSRFNHSPRPHIAAASTPSPDFPVLSPAQVKVLLVCKVVVHLRTLVSAVAGCWALAGEASGDARLQCKPHSSTVSFRS